MKTHEEIKKRLASLYHKYEHLYIKENLRPSPDNCTHNLLYSPVPLIPRPKDLELKVAPRKQHTLVVLDSTPQPIRICTYGSDSPETWNGDICDTDNHASECPYFAAAETAEDIREQFRVLMLDDDFVFENYKDVMALQWVTGHRISWHLEENTIPPLEEHIIPPLEEHITLPFYLIWWNFFRALISRRPLNQLPPKE